ncbi:MAG TPA: hypothetical protein VMX55_01180 [candidate division Zixibacteria bacterium]|nr:hypothetical protein [candidate division Zixibacteria bacterium]
MSGYIHTIDFKVIIDTEVIDFTFRIPRGSLLVQVLDELEATLKIQPRIIGIVNQAGEIVILENHYSTVDYLIQKYGTEFYAGSSSIVTFNHKEYIIDLEVPESIPFASTFRTACKGFSIKTRDAAIERQDGQVMDYEVFRMPTAFVLNSWGNFYRIVDRELGDPLIDPPSAEILEMISPDEEKSEIKDSMVYPPKLDESELLKIANRLVESAKTESELDKLTDNFVEKSYAKDEEISSVLETSDFITSPIEPIEERKYPWQITKDEDIEETPDSDLETSIDFEDDSGEEEKIDVEPTIESLLDEVLVVDEEDEEIEEVDIKDFEEDEIITDVETFDDEESIAPPRDKDLSDVLTFDEDRIHEDIPSDQLDEDLELYAQDYTEVEEELDSEEEDEEEEVEIAEEPFIYDREVEVDTDPEISIEDLPVVEDESFNDINSESTTDISEEIFVEEEELEESTSEIRPLETLTEDLVIEDETEKAIEVGEAIFTPIEDKIPLEERLEKRKKELEGLKAELKEEESIKSKIEQKNVTIEYYEKMNPKKIFQITVKIPPTMAVDVDDSEFIKVIPVFPGCYVTPHEELLDLKSTKLEIAEFNVTPLIGRGRVNGKIGLWYKGRNVMNINTNSKINNYMGSVVSAILAFVFGIVPFIPMLFGANINENLASGFNSVFSTSLTSNIFMIIELILLVILLGLMIMFVFVGKPSKTTLKRKFYPIALEDRH